MGAGFAQYEPTPGAGMPGPAQGGMSLGDLMQSRPAAGPAPAGAPVPGPADLGPTGPQGPGGPQAQGDEFDWRNYGVR